MVRPKQPNQLRLAARMKDLRVASGVSGTAFAARLGWPQSRVSKIETGKQIPTADDVDAWIGALQLEADAAAELHELAQAAQSEYLSWLQMFYARGGGAKAQEAIGSLERATTITREFWPTMMPGLLQTEAYARDAVSIPGGPRAWGAGKDEREKIVAARMARQAVLDEPGRQWHFVIGEAALLARFGSVETLAAQLEHLVVLMVERDAVDLRVLPLDVRLPAFPMAAFSIYDDHLVSLEQQVGEHTVVDPPQVKAYLEQFELLSNAALPPRRSVAFIRSVAGRLL
jgi:transcriptional regulator with XRE-family HTH domain